MPQEGVNKLKGQLNAASVQCKTLPPTADEALRRSRRKGQDKSDWMLDKEVFEQLTEKVRGAGLEFTIDGAVSETGDNAQLPRFITRN